MDQVRYQEDALLVWRLFRVLVEACWDDSARGIADSQKCDLNTGGGYFWVGAFLTFVDASEILQNN